MCCENRFVEPKYIGKGYGTLLWKHMVEKCRVLSIEKLQIVANPDAQQAEKVGPHEHSDPD
jgi:predicted acetyltransferase